MIRCSARTASVLVLIFFIFLVSFFFSFSLSICFHLSPQASWLFYAFTASTTVVLRRAQPHRPRPFVMPFYPLPPLLVACLALGISVSSLAASPLFVLLALCFVGAGLPVFWLAVDPGRPGAGGGDGNSGGGAAAVARCLAALAGCSSSGGGGEVKGKRAAGGRENGGAQRASGSLLS